MTAKYHEEYKGQAAAAINEEIKKRGQRIDKTGDGKMTISIYLY